MSETTEIDSPKKQVMLAALEQSMGIVAIAAKIAGINRTTHYLWMDTDPAYKLAVRNLRRIKVDFAESKLLERIKGVKVAKERVDGKLDVYETPPSDTAIIFLLKTLGKDEGYVERIENQIIAPRGTVVKWGDQELEV